MPQVIYKKQSVSTVGSLPAVGTQAPEFDLVGTNLETITLDQFKGKRVVLNIFPSLDTRACAASVRRFNELAAGLDETVVVSVSMDLPFAHDRFCVNEGIENVFSTSAFRSSFGEDYGVTMAEGLGRGLFSRAVVILDADGKVIYTEQVPEISNEPNYDAAIAALG